MAETHQVEAAGKRVAYLTAGPEAAPCVLLLHGGGIDRAARSWAETIPALEPDYRVIAPDLPGYGGSEGLGEVQDIARLGAWLVAFLDRVGAPPAHVVGNSMGGGIALWLALTHPGRVRSLVPVGSYGLARRAPLHPILWLWAQAIGGALVPRLCAGSRLAARAALVGVFRRPGRVTQALVDEMQAEARLQVRNRAFRAFLRGEVAPFSYRSSFAGRLAALDLPILLVHGRGDRLIGWRHARRAGQGLRQGEVLVMDAGHWPMREQPEAFTAALRDFLARAEGRCAGATQVT